MGTWRDRLGPASFRGVSFFIETSERSGGRRIVKHEYPLRDTPYVEDLGRKARVFPVDGYVLGPGYMDDRDALLAVLEQEGPGELIHPYHGRRLVVVTDYRVRESTQDGGVARFSVEFSETEDLPRFPTAVASASALATSTAKASTALSTSFAKRYKPGAVIDSLVATADGFLDAANAAVARAQLPFETAADMRVRLGRMAANVSTLVVSAADLLDSIVTTVQEFTLLPSLDLLYAFIPGLRPPATTPARMVEQGNYDVLVSLIQASVAIQAAAVAPDQDFDSQNAATVACSTILDRLEDQADTGVDDEVYAAIAQVRADLVRAIPVEGTVLPRVIKHTPAVTIPSLVLTYQLYGDLERETDILTRNQIEKPGFIIGGIALEVLSNA